MATRQVLIAAVVAGAAMARPVVVLVPDSAASTVTLQALVRLPKLNDAERFCALIAWDSILDGSEEYSRLTLLAYGQQAGRALVASALGDHLVLRVTFPKGQFATGISMFESLLRRPLLNEETLVAAIAKRQESERDPWSAALNPVSWSEGKPTREEVVSTFRRLVRPEKIVLGIGGAFEESEIARELSRFDDWSPPAERLVVRSWAARSRPALRVLGEVMFFELSGLERPAGAASFATDLLAETALGVGKGSALFQLAREANAWSYRQEAFLQPTPEGIRSRILIAKRPIDDPSAFLSEFSTELAKKVQSWTQADRARAVGQVKTWLERGLGISPVRLLPEGRVSSSLEEKTHFRAWWRMKFGTELNEAEVLRQMEQVKLDDLKAVALDIVEKSSGRFLVAGG